MDYATFNGLYTLFLILIFVALFFWAYSKRQKKSFEEMGDSIFTESQLQQMQNDANDKTGVKK